MAQNSEGKEASPKGQRDRSPSYPFISLKLAVERLVAFESYFGRHPARADKTGLAWDMKEKSSQAYQTLAALKYFGLVEYEGGGSERTASLTEDGRNLLRAQQDSIKQEILRRCALAPSQIKLYWEKWGADRPPDPICLDELVLKGKYTQSAAKTFLGVYDETIAYSGLSNSDKVGDSKSGGKTALAFNIGDLVQWECGGVLQFAQPRQITGLSDDGQFVFVEGSAAGLPIGEVTMVEVKPPSGVVDAPPQTQPPLRQHISFKQDVFSLDEGQVILQWPEKMSSASYEDFKAWLDLQLRKIGRAVKDE